MKKIIIPRWVVLGDFQAGRYELTNGKNGSFYMNLHAYWAPIFIKRTGRYGLGIIPKKEDIQAPCSLPHQDLLED